MTLPVRVGLRAANLTFQATQAVAERAIEAVGQVLTSSGSGRQSERHEEAGDGRPETQTSSGRNGRRTDGRAEAPADPRSAAVTDPPPQVAPEPPAEPSAETEPPAETDPAPESTVAEPPAPPVPPAPEPEHVSEEPELVEEVAEPGAEDGAGAAVRIDEPWEGYRELHADDIIARLQAATAAELAAVELYESAHRNRTTVLEAAAREFRRLENESH